MQKKLRKIMVIFLCLLFVVSGASIGNAALGASIILSPNVIAENAPVGTQVGVLSISSPIVGVNYTYELVNGLGDSDNASFTIVNIPYTITPFVRTNAAIDYETKNKYNIRIKATGSDGSSYVKKFVITVLNISDAPTAYDKTYTTKAGTAISGMLSANDFDGNVLTYSLGENTRGVSVANATYGTVAITNVNTGAFTYTPTTTFTGALTDSFKFSVFDGVYSSNNATATIKISSNTVIVSDLSLSIRPTMINFNSSNGKSPILAVIKLGNDYDFEDVDLDSLKIMVGETELKNIKKPARIYRDSDGNSYIKAMFYRANIPGTIEPDDKGKITFTASLALKNSTAASTLLQGSDEVKVKMPKTFKNENKNKNDDKKAKNDRDNDDEDDDDEDDDDEDND